MMRTTAIAFTIWCALITVAGAADDWERGFVQPPAAARPWVYWMWMDGNISREGLTADLEAMAGAGIGALVGASLSGERWRVVGRAPRRVVRFSFTPARGRGVAASVTVAF